MPRTLQDIIDHADELADRFEAYEPNPDDQRDAAPFRALIAAVTDRAHAEEAVAEAVHNAREAGYSWATIGGLLGTSREAARQRYGTKEAS